MPDNVQTMQENLHMDGPSMTSLVNGIIGDAQQLIRQEVLLARREMQEELNKAKTAAVSMGVGIALSAVAVLLLLFMAVYLLNWATTIPLWGCYGIVGGLSLAVAGVLFFAAKNQISKIDLVPRQTVETMKENVQWLKNQT